MVLSGLLIIFNVNYAQIQRQTNTRISFKDKPKENGSGTASGESVMVVRGSAACAQRAELEIKRLVLDMPIALTKEFLVPEYACGRIIGRGGGAVREMSLLSNCKIQVDKKCVKDISKNDFTVIGNLENLNTCKVVSLTGSFEQIETAKVRFLLNNRFFVCSS